jgi:hypothetical protein
MKQLIPGLALAAALAAAPAATSATATKVVQHLDEPRGIAFAPNGAMFVAEAGHGGAPCTIGGLNCYGLTGAITRYWHGETDRVVTGLPSIAFAAGAQARGPADIAVSRLGTARVTIGLEDGAANRDALERDGLGWLIRVPPSTLMAPSGHLRPDDWSFEIDVAWAVAPLESDPYAILAVPGGYVMTDASANALYDVGPQGELTLLAHLPSRPERTPFLTDSVPTAVAIGPDGAYYVGEFTGFAPPPPSGYSNIYRVVPGEPLQVYCTGFTRIIDIAFDTDGSLLVLQYATNSPPANFGPGVLWRVQLPPPDPDNPAPTCGARERVDTGIALDQPTAIAVGPDGAYYISNAGSRTGFLGEVLRIER